MQTQFIQDFKSKPKNKPLERNRPYKKNKEKFILSNLNFNSLFLNHQYINDFLPSFFYGVKSKYNEVINLNTKSNETSEIIDNLIFFLKKKFNLYKIDFVHNDNKKQILIFKELDYKDFNLYFIELENILKLKYKAKPLFNLLIGFLKQFNILHNSYIEHAMDMIDDEINENNWEEDFVKEIKYEFKGLKKINTAFKESVFDEELLNNYTPKKETYKKLVELLKKYTKLLDTKIFNKLAFSHSDFEEKENALFFHDLVGIIFNQGAIYEDYILANINSTFQEYDSIPPLDVMIIENNKVIKDFNINNKQLVLFHNFTCELNNLIEKL